ncbi:hypothetical protein SLA2020_442090 [Shorea laevis]
MPIKSECPINLQATYQFKWFYHLTVWFALALLEVRFSKATSPFPLNPGNASCGGILRDSQGRWVVGFLRNIGYTTALAAELWAIKDGLSIAKSLQLENVILETDCRVAYVLLSDNLNPFHPHSTLLMDCRDLLRTIPQVQMKHVLRESNMAADAIAKKGALAPHGFHFLFDCPPDVELLCMADRVGVCYPRQ